MKLFKEYKPTIRERIMHIHKKARSEYYICINDSFEIVQGVYLSDIDNWNIDDLLNPDYLDKNLNYEYHGVSNGEKYICLAFNRYNDTFDFDNDINNIKFIK